MPDLFQRNSESNKITKYTNDALNLTPEKFYDMLGLEKGTLMIPAMVKQGSITNTGFEVWASGTGTLNWISVGEFAVEGQPIIQSIEMIIQSL